MPISVLATIIDRSTKILKPSLASSNQQVSVIRKAGIAM